MKTLIEHIEINRLIPYARNSRTHSDEQIGQIAASIKEFGFTNPVLIDSEDMIIAGHGRVMAAQKLNLDNVPCIRLDYLTEAQKKAYVIADNKIALNAGWDDEMLRNELEELKLMDFDLDLLGFDDDELNSLMQDPENISEGLTDENVVPDAPIDPVTRLGDVWICGNHRVMCGDSTNIDDVDILTRGSEIDICFTSPPYNASVVITDGAHKKKYINNEDNLTSEDYSDFLMSFTSIAVQLCKFVFVNIQSLSNNKIALIDYLYKNKEFFADYIIWDKLSAEPAMASNVLNSQFEFILVFSKKANRSIGCVPFRGNLSNIIGISSKADKEFSNIHKATFPFKFAEYFVMNFSSNTVYDPFGGTGTTLIACEKSRRLSMVMELDPVYCDVIVKRWQDFTGKEAILESTGETFNRLNK